MRKVAWAVGVLGCGALAGCGGTDSGDKHPGAGGGPAMTGGSAGRGGSSTYAAGGAASCPFTACGGNIVGSWKVGPACVEPAGSMLCPGEKLDQTSTDDILTFAADGTVTEGSVTYTAEHDLPESCAEMLYQTSASEYCITEENSTTTTAGRHGTVDCMLNADVCHCKSVLTVDAQSGTYVTAGTQLTVATTVDYCVMGDTLTVRQPGKVSTGTYTRVAH